MFKALLKARFLSMFNLSKNNKKLKSGMIVLWVLLGIYLLGASAVMFGGLFLSLNTALNAMGMSALYYVFAFFMAFAFCFIGSVFATQAQIYNAKDNEMLLAMPIPPGMILLSRMTALLLLNYIYELIVLLPATFIAITFGHISAVGAFFLVLGIALLPFLSLAVSSLLGWLIALISSRLKNKNIVTTVLSIAFLVGYFSLVSQFDSIIEQFSAIASSMADVLVYFYPIYHLGLAVSEGNVLSMLIFVLCATIPFLLVYKVLSMSFIKIATTKSGTQKVKYKEKALKVGSQGSALVGKELKRFFSSATYMLNAGMGSILLIIGAVVLVVKAGAVSPAINQVFGEMGITIGSKDIIAAVSALVLSLSASMSVISAPAISLEGKGIWITQSLPVKTEKILLSKLYSHLIISLPAMIIGSIALSVVFELDIINWVAIMLFATLSAAFVGLIGLISNLKFPKLDWINETVPIKQGLSVVITMFGSMLVSGIFAVAFVAMLIVLDMRLSMFVCIVLFAVLDYLLLLVLKKWGAKTYEKL